MQMFSWVLNFFAIIFKFGPPDMMKRHSPWPWDFSTASNACGQGEEQKLAGGRFARLHDGKVSPQAPMDCCIALWIAASDF